jgi:hypothetical protein
MGEISPSERGGVRATMGRFAEGDLASSLAATAGRRRLGGRKSNAEEIGSGAVEDKQLRLPPRAKIDRSRMACKRKCPQATDAL